VFVVLLIVGNPMSAICPKPVTNEADLWGVISTNLD
jgi:hypothetical protein